MQVLHLFDKPRQQPYLFRFLDVVLEFSIKQSNHLADFMEYWERKKKVSALILPKTGRPLRFLLSISRKGWNILW
jgi:hypothetical protein